jgi:hypothetical protein
MTDFRDGENPTYPITTINQFQVSHAIVNDLQNWTLAPSPPEPVGTKSELVGAWQLASLFR